MRPAVGLSRPIMWRSRVLLPQPLPPMMVKISPRRTSNEILAWIRRRSNDMRRPSTWHITSIAGLDPEGIGAHREDGVDHDHADDAGDHRRRGGFTHRRRIASRAQAVIAAGHRHQRTEYETLRDADGE